MNITEIPTKDLILAILGALLFGSLIANYLQYEINRKD